VILRLRCAYIGAAVILFAAALRVLVGGFDFLENPAAAQLLTFFYTGRYVHLSAPETTPPTEGQPNNEKREDPLQISLQAGLSIEYRNQTMYDIPLEKWLTQPLSWDLTGEKPCVLIIHSHTTESYKNTGQYKESDAYRTLDEKHNMIAVGEHLTRILEAAGISVIHDKTVHDYPSYSAAYTRSRETILGHLAKNPQISLVIDLHRDAVEGSDGQQKALTATYNGKKAAMLEIVVGTDAGGQSHPTWGENGALAVKLQTVLEGEAPGLCRPVLFRTSRYNQDLTPGSLIVEVGAAGNTQQEAFNGVEVLAKAIIKMAKGVVVN
jgi:stage II sporulation protein P